MLCFDLLCFALKSYLIDQFSVRAAVRLCIRAFMRLAKKVLRLSSLHTLRFCIASHHTIPFSPPPYRDEQTTICENSSCEAIVPSSDCNFDFVEEEQDQRAGHSRPVSINL